MGLNDEIARASTIMHRYRVPKDEQVAVIKLLVDAGVNHCLDEQQRIRFEKDEAVQNAFGRPVQ